MSANMQIENLKRVLDRLDELMDKEKYEQALGRACALVERAAKEKAPKGNGELRRSITSTIKDGEGVIFTPLEYAPYVEYGTGLFAEESGRLDVPWVYCDDEGEWHTTSGMRPHPFMRPALQENREKVIEILREGITK